MDKIGYTGAVRGTFPLPFPTPMRPTPNDLSFNLFGFPTSIQPFFWLIAGLITALNAGPINDNMPLWILCLLFGMAGVLLSILVHELGHAFSFRYLFNVPCAIVLHGFGGAAIPQQHYQRSYGVCGVAMNCFLSFSGPLAGFALAFVMFVLLLAIQPAAASPFHFFLWWTMFISIFWGIINLLPIYPMDGGHIAREAFLFFFPRRGVEYSLLFSIGTAVVLGIAAFLLLGQIFIALFFGFFAYQNYQELSFGGVR